jgi:hypothetical protein
MQTNLGDSIKIRTWTQDYSDYAYKEQRALGHVGKKEEGADSGSSNSIKDHSQRLIPQII